VRIKPAGSVLGSAMPWRYPTPRPGNLRVVIRLALALLALSATAAAAAPAPAAVTVTGRAVSGIEGTELNTTVASGTTTSNSTLCLHATIDWGDGASSTGTIPAGGSSFTVRGRHTYAQAGAPNLVTTVRDSCNGASASGQSAVTIGDAPLTAAGAPVNAYARYPATVVVATFTDGNPFAKASDFTATVDWGDGTTGPATVSARLGGGFQVTGTNTYRVPDSYPVAVSIADVGGATATATTTATISSAPPPARLLAVGAAPGHDPLVGAYAPNGDLLLNFRAYRRRMTSGVRVATGDVNGDGAADVITAPGARGRALIEVFSGIDGHRLRRFRAFTGSFHAGVYVAAGDVDGDGKADIVVGAGEGGRPRVRVFSGATGQRIGSFFAWSRGRRLGVRVAAGDVDGDGRAEIAVAGGAGAGTTVTVFRFTGQRVARLHPDLRARHGLWIAAGDLNGDKLADLVLGGDGKVLALSADGQRLRALRPFGAGARNRGLRVAVADVDADGTPEIVVARLRKGAKLRGFNTATWRRVGNLLGGHPPPGAVYLG
jgi:fibronectin-binding autotransporter adhesin